MRVDIYKNLELSEVAATFEFNTQVKVDNRVGVIELSNTPPKSTYLELIFPPSSQVRRLAHSNAVATVT